MNTELEELLLSIIDSMIAEDSIDAWENGIFKNQRKIQIDKRGSVGERFLAQSLMRLYPRRMSYNDGDQGDWDLKIGRRTFEIKTSTLDKSNKFQNEGLKPNGDYDGILFLGISPNIIYFNCIKKEDIDWENLTIDHGIIHKKLHNRAERQTGAGIKCDLTPEQMHVVHSYTDLQEIFSKEFPDEWLNAR